MIAQAPVSDNRVHNELSTGKAAGDKQEVVVVVVVRGGRRSRVSEAQRPRIRFPPSATIWSRFLVACFLYISLFFIFYVYLCFVSASWD